MTDTTAQQADTFIECDAQELANQIGRNIFAISGGRIYARPTGVTIPVDCGYSVTVDLNWDDTYVVRRIFRRGTKTWIKGERTNVYCDEVGEAAYYASCFRSYSPRVAEQVRDRLVDPRYIRAPRPAVSYPLVCGHRAVAAEKSQIELAAGAEEFCEHCQEPRRLRRRRAYVSPLQRMGA